MDTRRPSSPPTSSTSGFQRGRDQTPRLPPSYASSSTSPSPAAASRLSPPLEGRPRVPPPIHLRPLSSQPSAGKGVLKIHVAAWDLSFVKPPQSPDLNPGSIDSSAREPPSEDTVLSGALEVIMKERRRAKSISVGVQSACRLHMGAERGWEEDGIFERGVEVMGGDADGIWLEKGSQSFGFSILLPATLATTDNHYCADVVYILTARVEGIPVTSSFFSRHLSAAPPALDPNIPYIGLFKRLMAPASKRPSRPSSRDASSRSVSRSRSRAPRSATAAHDQLSNALGELGLEGPDGAILANGNGEGTSSPHGLYHRSQSPHINPPSRTPSASGYARDIGNHDVTPPSGEATGWLKGDLYASREMVVHANSSETGGATSLNMRKQGSVDGLGSWSLRIAADVFSMACVLLVSLSIPAPSPRTTVFSLRLFMSQSYTVVSPRTPHLPPFSPENPRKFLLFDAGGPHRKGGRYPGREIESLWRGAEAGGSGQPGTGWKVKTVARLPDHDTMRPTTRGGTITPIRVKHEFVLHVFYSIEGESVYGQKVEGPGELRMLETKFPVVVPSCCCTDLALDLPTYDEAHEHPQDNIDAIIASPPGKYSCMCLSSFEELEEIALKRLKVLEDDADGEDNWSGEIRHVSQERSQSASARAKAAAEGRRVWYEGDDA
ncbi:hypothetical protein IAT38_004818 [Cryptococcus sp. DSM 104549]